jgi:hypothetical protein
MLIIIALTISYTCVQNLYAFFIENISFRHQMKNKQWNNIGAVPKSNGQSLEVSKIKNKNFCDESNVYHLKKYHFHPGVMLLVCVYVHVL